MYWYPSQAAMNDRTSMTEAQFPWHMSCPWYDGMSTTGRH